MTARGYYCHHPTPVGTLLLAGDGRVLWRIAFADETTGCQLSPAAAGLGSLAAHWQHKPDLFNPARTQLDEYFSGQRQRFELPLAAMGTGFQRRVWQALQAIPYGQTRSYQAIAEAIGKPAACRAVGMANHRNPLPVVIPCHRVIGKNGKLVGFGGGLPVKQQLLALEDRYR
jgi:methylated-DNA-[protein]-cysteine S-methyltransferase